MTMPAGALSFGLEASGGGAAAWNRRTNTGTLRMIVFGLFAVAIRMVDSLWIDSVCSVRLDRVVAFI